MKNFSFYSAFSFVALLPIAVMAQQPWVLQRAAGLPNSINPAAQFLALDDNVCWGISSIDPLYLRTTNGGNGNNWTVSAITGAAGGSASITALDSNTAWVCNNGAVYKTTDGGLTWDQQETAFQGFNGFPIVIHFFDSNNGVCVGDPNNGYWAIYTTTDGGTNWIRVPSANIPPPIPAEEAGISSIAEASGNSFWFATFWGSLYKTTDRGVTWTVARSILGNLEGFSFAFKDNSNGLACTFAGGKRISETSDGGINWEPITPLPSGLSGLSPYFIEYAKGTTGSYVITSNYNIGGFYPANPGTAYSDNDGKDWAQVDSLPHGRPSFSSPNNGWCAGLNDSVYHWESDILPVELVSFSANAIGNEIRLNWQTATEVNNQGFEIYRNGNKIAFVEGEGTTSEKQDYSFIDEGLQSGIYNYRLNQLDFEGTQGVVGELTVYLTLPGEFSLEQNYPNPFNPSTSIRYSIPTSEFVTLKIYDVLGNEVATLVNEEKPAGGYEVEFNAAKISSGMYLYTLQAGSYTQTKKLILMK